MHSIDVTEHDAGLGDHHSRSAVGMTELGATLCEEESCRCLRLSQKLLYFIHYNQMFFVLNSDKSEDEVIGLLCHATDRGINTLQRHWKGQRTSFENFSRGPTPDMDSWLLSPSEGNFDQVGTQDEESVAENIIIEAIHHNPRYSLHFVAMDRTEVQRLL